MLQPPLHSTPLHSAPLQLHLQLQVHYTTLITLHPTPLHYTNYNKSYYNNNHDDDDNNYYYEDNNYYYHHYTTLH